MPWCVCVLVCISVRPCEAHVGMSKHGSLLECVCPGYLHVMVGLYACQRVGRGLVRQGVCLCCVCVGVRVCFVVGTWNVWQCVLYVTCVAGSEPCCVSACVCNGTRASTCRGGCVGVRPRARVCVHVCLCVCVSSLSIHQSVDIWALPIVHEKQINKSKNGQKI